MNPCTLPDRTLETLLVFGNEAPTETVRKLRRQWPERAVVVELASEEEAIRWAEASADILPLEKLSPEALARIHTWVPGTRLAATGGVNAANAEACARARARILVTSAPYFAPPRDVAMTRSPLTPANEP